MKNITYNIDFKMTDLLAVESPYFTDLFEPGRQDRSIQEYEYVRIAPDCSEAPASVDAAPNLVFQVEDKDGIYLPSEAYLELTAKLTADDGTTAINNTTHALTNAWMLFKNCQFRIDNRVIEEKNEAGLGAYIRALIDYTPDYAESIASSSLFYKDTGAGGNGINPATLSSLTLTEGTPNTLDTSAITVNSSFNKGFYERNRLMVNGATMTLTIYMKDLFGYLQHTNKISYGNTLIWDLQRQTDYKRVIFRTDSEAGKVVLSKAVMWIPKIRADELTKGKLEAQLASGMSTIAPFYDWKMYDYSIPNGSTDVNWNVGNMPSKPVRVVVAFQVKARRSTYASNAALFDNAGCSRIWIEINSRKYPLRDYIPNFTTNDYAREYAAYLAAGRKCYSGNCEIGSLVNHKEFKDLFTLFCFDCSARDASIFDNSTTFNIVVRATVDSGSDYHVYCLVDTEKQLKLKGMTKKLEMIL